MSNLSVNINKEHNMLYMSNRRVYLWPNRLKDNRHMFSQYVLTYLGFLVM